MMNIFNQPMDTSKVTVVILAAGKGTRMQAPQDKNKVAYSLNNKPIILHTREMLKMAGLNSVIVVVGHAADSVKNVLHDTVAYAYQNEPKGTGDALKTSLSIIPESSSHILCMYGDDSAFYTPELIHKLLTSHIRASASITMLTIHTPEPAGLGRIIRNENKEIVGIIEEKNASDDQKLINEINTGLFCFDKDFLVKNIESINKNDVTGEYYLTDLISIAVSNGVKINAITENDNHVWFGINTQEQLEQAAKHQTYLQALHKKIKTPDILLNSVIEKGTGYSALHTSRIIKGESNEVYDVTLSNGSEVIVRINRKEADRFDREKWAIRQCANAGIPVPEVLYISSFQHEGSELAISIQTKLNGKSIRDIEQSGSLSKERTMSILKQAGAYVGMLHSIETNGFGRIDGNGKGRYLSDWEQVCELIQNEDSYVTAAQRNNIDSHKISKIIEILRDRTHEYTDTPRLQHADLGPDHIFVDKDDKIIGIIDFEGVAGGDPIRDFARWHYLYQKNMPIDWLLAGYPKNLIPLNFEQRLHRNRIRNSLQMLHYYDYMHNPNGIRIVRENIDLDLEFYRMVK